MTKSVMVVDEDNEFSTRIISLLKTTGANITPVKTNKEAIELIEKEETIRAVLLHTVMPDGKEVFVPFVKRDDGTLDMDVEILEESTDDEIINTLKRLVNL